MIKKILGGILLTLLVTLGSINAPRFHKQFLFNKVSQKSFQPFGIEGGSGSGFLVKSPLSGKTYLLTNYHVCEAFGAPGAVDGVLLLPVKVSNDTEVVQYRKILGMSVKSDVCAVEAYPNEEGLELSTSLRPQQSVFIVGHPLGFPIQLSEGVVVGEHKSVVMQKLSFMFFAVEYKAVLLNMHASPGNSGSAVVDSFGNVIGILFAGASRNDYSSLIIPSNQIAAFLALIDASMVK